MQTNKRYTRKTKRNINKSLIFDTLTCKSYKHRRKAKLQAK